MWVNEDSEEQDECTDLFLYSGCNQTCYGEKWMERFVKHIGYQPDWLHTEVRTFNGIGGGIETLGERELYITNWRTTKDNMCLVRFHRRRSRDRQHLYC